MNTIPDPYMTKADYAAMKKRMELEMEAMKYMKLDDFRRVQDITYNNWGGRHDNGPAYPPSYDWRRIAAELGHRHKEFRGIGPEHVKQLVQAIADITGPANQKDAFPHVGGYNYEDLFHQAMAALDAAYEGEDVEGDAAELLNLWQSILEKAEAR